MNLTQEREVPREKKNQEKVEKKNRTREKKKSSARKKKLSTRKKNRAREKKIEHAKKKSSARKKKIEREFREAQIGLRKGTTFLCGLRPSAQSAFDQTVCPTSQLFISLIN